MFANCIYENDIKGLEIARRFDGSFHRDVFYIRERQAAKTEVNSWSGIRISVHKALFTSAF